MAATLSGMDKVELSADWMVAVASDYNSIEDRARRFASELKSQIEQLLFDRGLSEASEVTCRVKSIDSVLQKLSSRQSENPRLNDIQDLIGIRVVTPFGRHLSTIEEAVHSAGQVLNRTNKSAFFSTNEFGYSSIHYSIKCHDSWLSVPTLSQFSGMKAEVQVRTMAQHVWATASHTLQYKSEENTPAPLRRSVHRLAALLELVDIEFERLLVERENYRKQLSINKGDLRNDSILNVDSLSAALEQELPSENRTADSEAFDSILAELNDIGVTTFGGLQEFVRRHKSIALKNDKDAVARIRDGKGNYKVVPERQQVGVFYNHTGLVRIMISQQRERQP